MSASSPSCLNVSIFFAVPPPRCNIHAIRRAIDRKSASEIPFRTHLRYQIWGPESIQQSPPPPCHKKTVICPGTRVFERIKESWLSVVTAKKITKEIFIENAPVELTKPKKPYGLAKQPGLSLHQEHPMFELGPPPAIRNQLRSAQTIQITAKEPMK